MMHKYHYYATCDANFIQEPCSNNVPPRNLHSRMRLGASLTYLARHAHAFRSLPHHVFRTSRLSSTRPVTMNYAHLRCMATSVPPQNSVLPLVLSSINLALPSGPFDDPATTHRASCHASPVSAVEEEPLLPMFLHSSLPKSPIGFLRPKVVEAILRDDEQGGKNSIWNVFRRPDDSPWAITFADHIADFEARSQAMSTCLKRWKDEGFFPDILRGISSLTLPGSLGFNFRLLGWSNEIYPVYTPQRCRPENHTTIHAFGIERAALPLFGFVNFGCLLTGKLLRPRLPASFPDSNPAFYDCPRTGRTMLWIPRRSLSKST
jgi:hypothetical protein